MKCFYSPILLLFVTLQLTGQKETQLLKIPYQIEEGYGPFNPAFRVDFFMSPEPTEGPWGKTRPSLKVPEEFVGYDKTEIWFNAGQHVFQHYHKGNIDSARIAHLIDSWNLDTTTYSRHPIRCVTYVVRGWNASGDTLFLMDTDIDLDLSDETPFTPQELDYELLDSQYKNAVMVNTEEYHHGKPHEVRVPVLFVHNRPYYQDNIPFYAKSILKEGNSELEITFNSSGFLSSDFTSSELIPIFHDSIRNRKASRDQIIEIGGYFQTASFNYRFVSVDTDNKLLLLEREPLNSELHVPQKGFYAPLFTAVDLLTGNQYNLDELKGKYVYLDFWATYCVPCIKEFPEMVKIHEKYKGKNFLILGIVLEDKKGGILKLLSKKGANWPQFISGNKKGSLMDLYHINGYPTTFLLNPEGKIIAKNLRSEGLKKKLEELQLH